MKAPMEQRHLDHCRLACDVTHAEFCRHLITPLAYGERVTENCTVIVDCNRSAQPNAKWHGRAKKCLSIYVNEICFWHAHTHTSADLIRICDFDMDD